MSVLHTRTSASVVSVDLSIIIPVFNEEQTLAQMGQTLFSVLKKTNKTFEVIFVDDGSKDHSGSELAKIYQSNPQNVRVIRLSRNFGHQLALTAGFHYCHGRAAIVLDCDLQDPPEVIHEFIKKWQEGYDIVYGVRTERQGESFFKKFTAQLFYKMIRKVTAIDIPENVGDFYLLDRKVIDLINTLRERHRFMRGLVAWAGFKRIGVNYVRHARFSGETKYSLWKMIKFSFDAITSFSFTPLRFVSSLGAIFAVTAFLSILVIIYMRLFTDATITGWSSLMAVILFIGGVQLLAIGIIGEYIARIGDDVKARPLYAVSEILE